MKREKVRIIFICIIFFYSLSVNSQSLDREYNNPKKITEVIDSYIKNKLSDNDSNFHCVDEYDLIHKIISFKKNRVMTNVFTELILVEEESESFNYTQNGNIYSWMQCPNENCQNSFVSKKNEFHINSDKNGGTLYEKTISGGMSIISKFSCQVIVSKNIKKSSTNSETENLKKKLDELDQLHRNTGSLYVISTMNEQCKSKDVRSCLILFLLYFNGELDLGKGSFIVKSEINKNLSFKYLNDACELNDGKSCFGCAVLGRKDNIIDGNTAIKYLKKSCELNFEKACNHLNQFSEIYLRQQK